MMNDRGLHGALGGGVSRPAHHGGGAAASDPFALVDAATSEFLLGQPDWSTNMQIVDLLAQMPRDAGAVLELLSKKLMSKKHGTGFLAVVLLEALVKNVRSLHPVIAQREFLEGILVKSLPRSIRKPHDGPSLNSLFNEPGDIKSDLAIQRWEAILKCIQAWSIAFNPEEYPIFKEVHRMLERRGVRFPPVDKEENAPVFVPEKPRAQPSAPLQHAQHEQPSAGSGVGNGGAVGLSHNALNDIASSTETATIFADMLNNSDPDYPLAEDELIAQLYNTCRSNASILSTRLTRAANGESNADEESMMRLLAAHERVQEVLNLYADIVAGVRRPGDAKASGSRQPARGGGFNESKEDHESVQQPRHAPAAEVVARSALADPFAAPPAHSRRKSDLPPEIAQFDMLGLSESPPPAQHQQQQHYPAAQPHPVPQPHVHFPTPVQDPFASFPMPSNPVASVAMSASAPAPVPAPTSAKRQSLGALLPPPPASSTRHRKDSAARRGSGEHAAALGLSPSPKLAAVSVQTPAAPVAAAGGDSFFNLDLLMEANSPAPTLQAPPANPYSFATATSATNTSPNIFDSFEVIGGDPTAPTHPVASGNPFDSFNSHSPPTEDDPFAAIATRTSVSSPNVFQF